MPPPAQDDRTLVQYARLADDIAALERRMDSHELSTKEINSQMQMTIAEMRKVREEVSELSGPMREIIAGLRAVRWFGVLIVGVVALLKTGDVSALVRALTGGN